MRAREQRRAPRRPAALGLVACVDELFARDGTCEPNPDPTFTHFTALPPPSDYQATCFTESPPCTATADEARLTLDRAGNLLVPVYWQGVLVKDGDQPVPRLLRATIKPPVPVTIPSGVFVTSLTTEGQRLPPIFEPQTDPTTVDRPRRSSFFGSVDVRQTVLRIAHRRGVCQGGTEDGADCNTDARLQRRAPAPTPASAARNDGLTCGDDGDCPGGTLRRRSTTPPRSRRSRRTAAPIVAAARRAGRRRRHLPGRRQRGLHRRSAVHRGRRYLRALRARGAELRSRSTASPPRPATSSCSPAPRALDGVDRNGDGDVGDFVVTLRDRATGEPLPLGAPAGFAPAARRSRPAASPGRPRAARSSSLNQQGFVLPAIAFEGEAAAFLESEAGENFCDENGDGDRTDAILRVFTLDRRRGERRRRAAARPRPVAARGRPAARDLGRQRLLPHLGGVVGRRWSGALVSVDARLPATEGDATRRVPGADISRDGRVVAFVSDGPIDGHGQRRERHAGRLRARPPRRHDRARERADAAAPSRRSPAPTARSRSPATAASSRSRATATTSSPATPTSAAATRSPARTSSSRDRVPGTTERVSVGPSGVQAQRHTRASR